MPDDAIMPEALRAAYRLHEAGSFAGAAQLYDEFLRTHPRDYQALLLLGLARLQLRQPDVAERLFALASNINPRAPEALRNRGCALQQLGRHAEALLCYERALAIAPGAAQILVHRADALFELKRTEEAVSVYREALAIRGDHASAWYNCGAALLALEQPEEALVCFESAANLSPYDVGLLMQCSTLLMKLGRLHDALTSFERVLALDPNHIEALLARASLLTGLRRYAQAAEHYEQAYRIAPDYPYLKGNLLQSLLHCCDWRSLEEHKRQIAQDLRLGKRAATPVTNVMWCEAPEDQLLCSKLWVAHEAPALPALLWRGERYRHDRIRLAYVAPELGSNPAMTQIAGVLEQHDRSRFETTLLSFGRDPESPFRTRIEKSCEHFFDIAPKDDRDAARLIRQRETDILIDLTGLGGYCRTGILALRPSPVQVSYLGFPSTMGASYVDYLIADAIAIPEEEERYYTEKIVYLPDTSIPNDTARATLARLDRRRAGLPENGFVFCSFTDNSNLRPELFTIWCRLLSQVENSFLWLPEYNQAAINNLKREVLERRVDTKRLIFAPTPASLEEYFARLSLADLFLDTLPYNAASAVCDALSCGLPVLTALGKSFAGRISASVVNAMGMPELIASSLVDYEVRALSLARAPGALTALRLKIATNRADSLLFDTVRFTRQLESAYFSIWERHQRGVPPVSFTVPRI